MGDPGEAYLSLHGRLPRGQGLRSGRRLEHFRDEGIGRGRLRGAVHSGVWKGLRLEPWAIHPWSLACWLIVSKVSWPEGFKAVYRLMRHI